MKCLVLGASGLIGTHLVKRLKDEGHVVIAVDWVRPEFEPSAADQFNIWDLRTIEPTSYLFEDVDEIYQLAAEVGGLGYIMDKENDAEVLHNSMRINLNVLEAIRSHPYTKRKPRVFFASSACVYPTLPMQRLDSGRGKFVYHTDQACREPDAWPYQGDNFYAHEKMFAEFLYDSYARNYGIDIHIGRCHNSFGELGTWTGGREKFPAALCRKIAEVPAGGGRISLWGDGTQTRSFTYVSDTVDGIIRLTRSDFQGPVNIGSSRMVTIDEVARMVIAMAGKWVEIDYEDGPVGVLGRNSDNALIREKLGWEPKYPLESGLLNTYRWIHTQVLKARGKARPSINGLPIDSMSSAV